jgi:superfamily I DNA and RNA helicase
MNSTVLENMILDELQDNPQDAYTLFYRMTLDNNPFDITDDEIEYALDMLESCNLIEWDNDNGVYNSKV